MRNFEHILGDPLTFMHTMFAHAEAEKEKQRKIDAGITRNEESGCEGIERLNIPHKYDTIKIKDEYFYCFFDSRVTVHNKEGKYLFDSTRVEYCKEGLFLVADETENPKKEVGYALYNEHGKLTEFIFRPHMSNKFNEHGFATVGLFHGYGSAIINKKGEILVEAKSYGDLYLHGVVASRREGYINLLTGETICEKGYNSQLSTDDFMFIQVELNCIYQINKKTGEYVIHGEKKPKPAPVERKPAPLPKPIETKREQTRNELCECGSGKKYKKCCIDKK